MHEVEAKVPVDDPDAFRRRMQELGAPLSAPRRQDDLFFQHPQRDLAATDEALRLRTEEGFQELTYKGPKEVTEAVGWADGARGAGGPDGAGGIGGTRGPGMKARVEWNVPVGADPTALLAALGFRPAARLRKHREQARLEACEVTLDQVEGLGWFVEVEALHEDTGRAAAAVRKTLVRLGLQDVAHVDASYLELALDAGAGAAGHL